jgi:hypothetical protein
LLVVLVVSEWFESESVCDGQESSSGEGTGRFVMTDRDGKVRLWDVRSLGSGSVSELSLPGCSSLCSLRGERVVCVSNSEVVLLSCAGSVLSESRRWFWWSDCDVSWLSSDVVIGSHHVLDVSSGAMWVNEKSIFLPASTVMLVS